jgi:hypothetical protein
MATALALTLTFPRQFRKSGFVTNQKTVFDDQTLKFKSHNTGHQGDVFQFIADLNSIDCKANPKTLFSSLSVRVVCAFGLIALLSVFYIVRFLQLAAFGSETPKEKGLLSQPLCMLFWWKILICSFIPF